MCIASVAEWPKAADSCVICFWVSKVLNNKTLRLTNKYSILNITMFSLSVKI